MTYPPNFEALLYYTALGISIVSTLTIVRWWRQKYLYRCLRELPSPPSHWLLGNLPQILAAVREKKLFQLLFNWAREFGPIYVYWLGNSPIVILSDPKQIENTIVNGMREGSLVRTKRIRRAWNDIGGPILLGTSGAEWQWRRKAWNPEFTSPVLSKHLAVIEKACWQVVETIQQAPSPRKVKTDPLFVGLTMRVIAYFLLGIPVDSKDLTSPGPPLEVERTYQAISVLGYRFLRVATGEKRWMKYLPTQSSQDYWQARNYLENFLTPRIDLALKMRDNPCQNWEEVNPSFKQSMLVKIAAKEPRYDRASLMAESIELLIAGTDTTAHSLSFALAELSLNPSVFQKAQSAVDRAWENHGGINLKSLEELSYIRAVFKETLRLYSVASGSTSLQAERTTSLAGQVIPRGTGIFWSMLAAGRDATVYPNPEEFLPERWLERDRSHTAPLMIDFGSGLHRCLGENLAILEATLMLAMLLRHFDWDLVNGRSSLENLQQNLLIYPTDGMPVNFRGRIQ